MRSAVIGAKGIKCGQWLLGPGEEDRSLGGGKGDEIVLGAGGIKYGHRGRRRDIEIDGLWGCTRGMRYQVRALGSREAAGSYGSGEVGGAGAAGTGGRDQWLKREGIG